ncbi:single-strand DNA-binding protein [Arthrobacter sp. ov407]|uniref:single-stranded DNA-binding protein n=1 Tax=Arthrobacter sp. ov407 TaxID=1761748 RepID=UPI0008858971|nr:single-stranded DNA-binding protein [Arthrobacter sp. ov407]SDK96127.1 single-strand DNA-binding protein [Arthrobacter sp. ov407]
MSDNITVRGFVATEIRSSTTPGGVATASFRLGATDRRYDRGSSTWVDVNTNWFTVQGYRQLAGNMGCSIKKGQRVIVVGRLKMRSWEKDGRVYHDAEINAESVGHDLMWGSANFTRSAAAGSQTAAGSGALGAPGSGDGDVGGPQTQSGDAGGDTNGDAGGDGGPDHHAIFIDDASGEEEEVDQETGELKGAAA